MDELDLEQNEITNKAEERIKTLSSKVKETSQERDAAKAAQEASEAARLAAEKDRDFYAALPDVATKYPGSLEYKDKIKEKVGAGYTVEDAAVAVLNAEGKLTPSTPPPPPPQPAAGGSAVNNLGTGTKSVAEMTQQERRQGLVDAEKRGDISLS